MLKLVYSILVIIFLTSSQYSKGQVVQKLINGTIEFNIKNLDTPWVFIKSIQDNLFTDSLMLRNGVGKIRYRLDEPCAVKIFYKKNGKRVIYLRKFDYSEHSKVLSDAFVLEDGEMRINGDVDDKTSFVLGKSKETQFYQQYVQWGHLKIPNDSSRRTEIRQLQVLDNLNFVKKNADLFGPVQKLNQVKSEYNRKELELFIKAFNPRYLNTPSAVAIKDYISYLYLLEEQGIQDKILTVDTAGVQYELNKIADGKKRLLIFWASWCIPCIEEIPELKKLYGKQGDKVSFISLSSDNNIQSWKRAVRANSVPWLNVRPITNSEVFRRKLKINAIPIMYLISKEGKILMVSSDLKTIQAKIQTE